MKLWELFDDGSNLELGSGDGQMTHRLRQAVIDMLIPLRAQGVPYVSIDAILDKIREMRSGIEADRGLVMQVLDPQKVKMITKIEGDRIYFTLPDDGSSEAADDQKQKDADHVQNTAAKQAQKNVQS